MKLKKLLRAEELAEKSKKIIKLDYSHVDIQEKPNGEEKNKNEAQNQEIVQKAKEEAFIIIQKAKNEADTIIEKAKNTYDTQLDIMVQDQAEKSALLEKEYASKSELLGLQYKQKEEKLELERKKIFEELEQSRDILRREIYNEIADQVRKEVYVNVKKEYAQLINQVHTILDQAIVKRREMLQDFESEFTDLIMLIVRKIVKVITEEDRNIIIKNLHHALSLLKTREHFLIHINTLDVDVVKNDIDSIKELLSIKGTITVVEDTTVEPGGCVIETELGEIDARISTQLLEMSNKIRELSPIRNAKY